MNKILHEAYLAGYRGWVMPRSIRKRIAKGQVHRAWFLGFNGYFEQDGTKYGLSNRYSAD